jgi:hypothetical protein
MICKLYCAVCPAVTEAIVELFCAGITLTAGFAFPLMAIICGEPGASSFTRMVAERPPAARGAKVTFMVQAAFTISCEQLEGEMVKSLALAPLSMMEEICSGTFPELVSVTG